MMGRTEAGEQEVAQTVQRATIYWKTLKEKLHEMLSGFPSMSFATAACDFVGFNKTITADMSPP